MTAAAPSGSPDWQDFLTEIRETLCEDVLTCADRFPDAHTTEHTMISRAWDFLMTTLKAVVMLVLITLLMPLPVYAQSFGGWEVTEHIDPIDDHRTIFISALVGPGRWKGWVYV